jgi:hypothetical protein
MMKSLWDFSPCPNVSAVETALTNYAALKKWVCLDSATGEALAEAVRKDHPPDFSNWKNHDAFERAFARLAKDLRTSIL